MTRTSTPAAGCCWWGTPSSASTGCCRCTPPPSWRCWPTGSCVTGGSPARPHDLRHSFAVASLLDWCRDGGDIASRMPLLSAYLGHASPEHTYWYLSASPELLAEAARRLAAPGAPR